MKSIFYYETIVGKIGIAEENGAITNIYLCSEERPDLTLEKETELLAKAAKQLNEYFTGSRKSFDLPLAPQGTTFQQKVWNALKAIPYGETRSYGEIAKSIQQPKAARAVGMANNRNPIALVIPCHRVIGANGKLVGYAGGLEVKEKLLNIEKTYK